MLAIEQILPGSAAEAAGVEIHDQLMAVGVRSINDLVDYHLALAADVDLEVLLQDAAGKVRVVFIPRSADEDPGIVPQHPEPARCGNDCLFCFVHQLPKGLRRSLYVKDEDYRFSWLYGAYITLGNIRKTELARIIADHLSPLYISVHATDEVCRQRLLGKPVAPILPLLERLCAAGIELHTQIVVCPGLNDGRVLRQTIEDLRHFWPQIRSLAVVPVGLTRHRQHLPLLAVPSPLQAQDILDLIAGFQTLQLKQTGSRFVFAADELYLRAGRELPPLADYEDLWQRENGVGLLAGFRSEVAEVLLDAVPLEMKKVSLVTGTSFAEELRSFATQLGLRTGVKLQVIAVENHFFGTSVSVAGLLTGADILTALKGQDLGEGVLLPDVIFRQADDLLLDNLSLKDLQQQFDLPLLVVNSDPWGILDGLERLDCPDIEILEG